MPRCRTILLSVLFGLLCGEEIHAADKSGVSPNTISLPTGPGSIEGLGESFEPTLNSGTASYSVPLRVPPGTAGHTPSLALTYESGHGNGPLGFGWTLPLAYIQRQTDKGIPRYVDDRQNGIDDDFDGQIDEPDEVDRFINEINEELVPQADGYYFCENEGAFIRYRRIGNSWEGTAPDGTRMQFGLTSSGRVEDNGRAFKWLLEQSTDTHGNTIRYSYTSFPDPTNLNQKYLAVIAYGPGPQPWNNFHFVRFTYENRSDWFEDGRAGFLVRTGKRLKEIVVGTQGPALSGHLAGDFNQDGTADYLVRKYVLSYLDYAPPNSHWSLVSQVLPVGADGVSTLPPARFGYAVCNPPQTLSAAVHIVGSLNEPVVIMDSELADLVDLNGDGLPDLLKTEQFGGAHSAFINQGEVQTNGLRAIQWSAAREVASADGLAWSVDLKSAQDVAHLADMDGDGLADLVYRTTLGQVYYFLNEGKLRWGERKDMSVLDFSPPSPFGSFDVKTADLDFDKRIDVIQSLSVAGGAEYRIWFNRGDQRYSFGRTVSPTAGFMFSDQGVQIADFNGDRVPDITRLRPYTLTVAAGLGHGLFADAMAVTIPDVALEDDQIEKARLQDVTGDGLADLVIERAAPGELWYWVNLGNYSLGPRRLITDMPAGLSPKAAVRWADLNGNGTTDLIYADSTAEPRIQTVDIGRLMGCVPRPNLLTSIANGIGRVTTITYDTSTRFALEDAATGHSWPDVMPFPVTVVASVTNSDSLGHFYATKFRYHDGYYDPNEKEFRGFARVEVIELGDPTAPTLVTRSQFDTGKVFEAMKGKLLRLTAEQEDGRPFWDEFTSWTIPPRILRTGINSQTVNYVHPRARVRIIDELGQGTQRRLESEFTYDIYGNQTTNADYGIVENGNRAAFNDERITKTAFALNLDAWLLRFPSRIEISDEDGVVIAKQENFYDDETFSAGNSGVVMKGDLTLNRAWVDPSNPAAFIHFTRTKFDAYGNPILLLDPLARAPGGSVDLTAGHGREVAYDPLFHAYPTRETIHIGGATGGGPAEPLVVDATYDAGFGTVTASLDFNRRQTTYGRDAFGRLIHILKPGDPPGYPSVEYEYALSQTTGASGLINFIETRTLDRAPGTAPAKRDHYFISRQFSDGLGRALMRKQEAELTTELPRVIITAAAQFNSRQKPARELSPCYTLLAGANLEALLAFENITEPNWQGLFHEQGQWVARGLASAHQDRTEYDGTLRPIKSIRADGSFSRVVFEPLVTRFSDENDTDPNSPHFATPKVQYSDGLGRAIRTDEIVNLNDDGTTAGELKTWTTTFQYDLNDQLTQITDSKGNLKRMRYDALKRKTYMDDPDRGKIACQYDDASNLTRLIDNPGTTTERVTVFGYDGANRITSEDYLDSSYPAVSFHRDPDVTYHYDVPSAAYPSAQNLRGRLVYVEDLSGAEFHSFDHRGNPEWRVKRIDTLHGTRDFKTAFKYDSADRVSEMTYPDGERVQQFYNERSLLKTIPGFLTLVTYLPSGQILQEQLANGAVSDRAYDSRARMIRLQTSLLTPTQTVLQDYLYRFDPVGNILEITDQVGPDHSPGSADQLFAYDCLYRLTSAQSEVSGNLHYRYSPIGNLIHQSAESGDPRIDLGNYQYGTRIDVNGAGPHAVMAVDGGTHGRLAVAYDAYGNYRLRGNTAFQFDFQNRLLRAQSPPQPNQLESLSEYRYDYHGQRIIKRFAIGGTTNETLYPGPEFELRDDRQIKFIFAGSRRLARIETKLFRQPLAAGWNLVGLPVEPTYPNLSNVLSSLAQSWTVAALHDNASQTWLVSRSDDPASWNRELHFGNGFWLNLAQPAELRLSGAIPSAAGVNLTPGWNLVGLGQNTNLAALENRIAGPLEIRGYSTDPGATDVTRWNSSTKGGPAFLNTLNSLRPDQPCWLRVTNPSTLSLYETGTPRTVFYHPDHLGSANFLTDDQGRLVETTEFYPFGVERYSQRPGALKSEYRYTGKERDEDTGLTYYGARYYDSLVGRFINPDPLYTELDGLSSEGLQGVLSDPQKFSLYSYALNNPFKYTDPTGLDVVLVGLTFSGGFVGGGQITIGYFVQSGEHPDVGIYVSRGAGIQTPTVGAGLSIGYNPGSMKDVTGSAITEGGSAGPIGAQRSVSLTGGRTTYEVSVGTSVAPAEAHYVKSQTDAVGIYSALTKGASSARSLNDVAAGFGRLVQNAIDAPNRAFRQTARGVILRSIVELSLTPSQYVKLAPEQHKQWVDQIGVLNQWYWQLGGTQEEYNKAFE